MDIGFFAQSILLTQNLEGLGLGCLSTPGLSKDIRCHV